MTNIKKPDGTYYTDEELRNIVRGVVAEETPKLIKEWKKFIGLKETDKLKLE